MSPEPRASERAGARESLGLTRARRTRIVALALAACALGAACRQTVVLDTPERLDGGAGSSGAAGSSVLLDSGTGGDKNGNAGNGGGNHFDGGRLDAFPLCLGGQIQDLPFTMRSPYVIVSVDRSSDMQTYFGTGTRLEVIQQQVQALVSKYRVVKFGYQEFPAPMGMCANGQGCCAGDVGALPSYNNLKAIKQVIHACDGNGPGCNETQRPIADALSKCYDTFKSVVPPEDNGHRYVLLFTSGDPTCGSDPMSTPCNDAVARVTKLSNTFTNTAVFAVGDAAAGSACLDMLVTYGQIDGHTVKTPNDLSSALGTVVDTIADEACKIDLRSSPTDPDKVQLLFDGVPVPKDGMDGWTFDDPGTNLTLTVNGSYCQTLVQSTARVDLVMGCLPPHN